jgi:hypothetical protein
MSFGSVHNASTNDKCELSRARYLRCIDGDLNGDGVVNVIDLGILNSNWGKSGSNLSGDINGEGVVNVQDLGILLSNWGKCPTENRTCQYWVERSGEIGWPDAAGIAIIDALALGPVASLTVLTAQWAVVNCSAFARYCDATGQSIAHEFFGSVRSVSMQKFGGDRGPDLSWEEFEEQVLRKALRHWNQQAILPKYGSGVRLREFYQALTELYKYHFVRGGWNLTYVDESAFTRDFGVAHDKACNAG